MDLPWPTLVGGVHDVVVVEPWPAGISPIHENFFAGVSSDAPRFDYPHYEDCGCHHICVGEGGSCCTNFRTNALCHRSNCPNGIGCGNRFIEEYPLELITSACGIGVASTRSIPKHAFVVENNGELIDEVEKERGDYPDYPIQIRHPTADGRSFFLDAAKCGNMSRFINHSCRPNAVFYEYQCGNSTRIGIFTINHIEPLQELCVSYSPVAENNQLRFRCRCGWLSCTGRKHQDAYSHCVVSTSSDGSDIARQSRRHAGIYGSEGRIQRSDALADHRASHSSVRAAPGRQNPHRCRLRQTKLSRYFCTAPPQH